MLTRKYLESEDAKKIYKEIGNRCVKDISQLKPLLKKKGNVRIDLPNSVIETKGSTTTISQTVQMDDSDKVITFHASQDDKCDFYDINIDIKKAGTDLLTGEGYSRKLANVNYFFMPGVVMITKIKDEEELEKEEQERLAAVQKGIHQQVS